MPSSPMPGKDFRTKMRRPVAPADLSAGAWTKCCVREPYRARNGLSGMSTTTRKQANGNADAGKRLEQPVAEAVGWSCKCEDDIQTGSRASPALLPIHSGALEPGQQPPRQCCTNTSLPRQECSRLPSCSPSTAHPNKTKELVTPRRVFLLCLSFTTSCHDHSFLRQLLPLFKTAKQDRSCISVPNPSHLTRGKRAPM